MAIRVGLISDTHIPRYCRRLPETVFNIFDGVDLILHAGDVGELRVLDELSRIAPVVAVHGNDDHPDCKQALPFLQTVVVAGHRIVITHGHFQDPVAEAAQRRDDGWQNKFDHLASVAEANGADVIVYGHSHIPMVCCHERVWVVNPGAIASPGVLYKQIVSTVALLLLAPDKSPEIQHIDVTQPDQLHQTASDWEHGFNAILGRYCHPIFEPLLFDQVQWIREHLVPIVPQAVDLLLPLAHECWDGQRDYITTADFIAAIKTFPLIPPQVFERLHENPHFAQFL